MRAHPPPSATVRLHGLDTLRGISALLVVLLHAGIPYMIRPLSHLAWPAMDECPCPLVDGIGWSIECFIMPLFFVLAGFFSAGLITLYGAKSFLKHRTRRLLLPQIAAGIVILPLCLYLWALGWVADGLFVPRGYFIPGIPARLREDLWGTAHLWFLQYLYIYCVLLWGQKVLHDRLGEGAGAWTKGIAGRLDRLMLSPLKPLLPAVPCALILYWDPRIVIGFYQSFVPVASKLAYYAIYYFVGVWAHRQHRALFLQARFGKSYLLAAAGLFALLLPLIHEHRAAELSGGARAVLAMLLALFAWLMTYGLLALFLRSRRGCSAVAKYLADASYWVYLVHLPLVALTQIAIARAPLVTPLKFLVSAATAMALSLMSYQVFARYTWVGEFLTGCRRRRETQVSASAILAPQTPLLVPSLNSDRLKAA